MSWVLLLLRTLYVGCLKEGTPICLVMSVALLGGSLGAWGVSAFLAPKFWLVVCGVLCSFLGSGLLAIILVEQRIG